MECWHVYSEFETVGKATRMMNSIPVERNRARSGHEKNKNVVIRRTFNLDRCEPKDYAVVRPFVN